MRAFLPVLVVAVALPLAGCTEDVDATLGTDVAFSVYGVLTPAADTQWVRVFPVEPTLVPAPPEALGAVVRSFDETTGEELRWRDTVMTATDAGPGEAFGYFYWAAFRAAYGHTYRIEVAREGRAVARAVARMPERSELEVLPAASQQTSTVTALVRGTASHFLNVRVIYDIRYGPVASAGMRRIQRYDGAALPAEGGWQLRIDLGEDQREIENFLRANRIYDLSYGVELRHMTLQLVVADPAWDPPGGGFDFDPNVLVEPHLLTNVSGGFGFVGAGYRLDHTWLPEAHVLLNAGFRIHDENDTTIVPPFLLP